MGLSLGGLLLGLVMAHSELGAYEPSPLASPTCLKDGDCEEGSLCCHGDCRRPSCEHEDDCERGELCLNYACVKPSCSRHTDCGSNERCFDGYCQQPVIEVLGSDQRTMVLIRGGSFLMGSSEDDAVSDERPQHWAQVSSFWLDEYEVRVEDFERCVAAGGCQLEGVLQHDKEARCQYGSNTTNAPMNCVSWDQAQAYCEFAGKRLPTEAEWERAAGGGQGVRFPWGGAGPNCDFLCRRGHDSDGCDTGLPCPVGSKEDISMSGVVDLGGNLSEWVSDWYDDDYYSVAPRLNPQGPESGERRSVRGGDYSDLYDPFRVISRDRLLPELRSTVVGFRCAKNI